MLLIIALLCFVAQIVLWVMLPASTLPESGYSPVIASDPVPVAVAKAGR